MMEQQLQDKLDEYYNRGIQQGIRMVKDKMLLACKREHRLKLTEECII